MATTTLSYDTRTDLGSIDHARLDVDVRDPSLTEILATACRDERLYQRDRFGAVHHGDGAWALIVGQELHEAIGAWLSPPAGVGLCRHEVLQVYAVLHARFEQAGAREASWVGRTGATFEGGPNLDLSESTLPKTLRRLRSHAHTTTPDWTSLYFSIARALRAVGVVARFDASLIHEREAYFDVPIRDGNDHINYGFPSFLRTMRAVALQDGHISSASPFPENALDEVQAAFDAGSGTPRSIARTLASDYRVMPCGAVAPYG